jgi:hypothetical protein
MMNIEHATAILYLVMLLELNEEIMFDEEDRLMNDENHHRMLQLVGYQTSTSMLIDALGKE